MLDIQQQQQDACSQQLGGRRLRGLSWNKTHEAWRVRIYFHGKLRFVGRFEDAVIAAKHYDKAAMYLYGDNAITNFGLDACKADSTTPVGACIIQAKQEAEEAAKQQAGHLQQEQHRRLQQQQQQQQHKQGRFVHMQCKSKVSQQLLGNIPQLSDNLSLPVPQHLPPAATFTIGERQQEQLPLFDPQLQQLQLQLALQEFQGHEQQQQLLQLAPQLWQSNTVYAPGCSASDIHCPSAPVTPVASAVMAAAAAAASDASFRGNQQHMLTGQYQQSMDQQQQGALRPLVNGGNLQGCSVPAMSCCLPDMMSQQLLPTLHPALAGPAHSVATAGGLLPGLSLTEQQFTQLRQQQLQLEQQQRDAEELLRQLKQLAVHDTSNISGNTTTSSSSSYVRSPSLQILKMVAADSSNLAIPAHQQHQQSTQQLPFMPLPANSIVCSHMQVPAAPAGAVTNMTTMAAAAAAAGLGTSVTGSGCRSPVTPPLLGASPHWLTVNRFLQGSGDYAESVASIASSGVLEHLAVAGL